MKIIFWNTFLLSVLLDYLHDLTLAFRIPGKNSEDEKVKKTEYGFIYQNSQQQTKYSRLLKGKEPDKVIFPNSIHKEMVF